MMTKKKDGELLKVENSEQKNSDSLKIGKEQLVNVKTACDVIKMHNRMKFVANKMYGDIKRTIKDWRSRFIKDGII